MAMSDKLLVLMAGAAFALSPLAAAKTCKPGTKPGASARCKAPPPARAAKAGKKGKAGAAAPRGLVEFVDSKGCRLFAADSAVKRMREIDAVGSVTWDGKCQGGLASGPGLLRQEGMSVEGGRSKRFAYYFSGTAQKGVRTGPWTRETFDRFADSPKSWTSLARMEFVQGIAKGAPRPVPVGGQNQHTDAFRTRVLEPDSKRDQPAEPAGNSLPSLIVADSLSSKPVATSVAALIPAPAVMASVPPPAATVAPAASPAPTPAPAIRPARAVETPVVLSAASPVAAPPVAPVSAPATEPVPAKPPPGKPTAAPVAAPAPVSKPVAPAPIPAKEVVPKLSAEMPASIAGQSFAFGTGCYMDTLDGRIWENEVLPVQDRKAIRINGWGVDDEGKRLPEATFLRLEGTTGKRYYAATTPEDRPDVAKFLGNTGFLRSGYRALISAEQLPAGEYEVAIVMNAGGRNILCGNGRKLKLPGI